MTLPFSDAFRQFAHKSDKNICLSRKSMIYYRLIESIAQILKRGGVKPRRQAASFIGVATVVWRHSFELGKKFIPTNAL